MLRKIYLSPIGILISAILNLIATLRRPFMVYGYYDRSSGRFRKNTRVSSSAVISDKKTVSVADNVWIWHHTIIDGSNSVTIEEGCQIGAWVGIFSHGSHIAVRLYGSDYIKIPREARKGYTRGAVHIGPYCFVGAGALIMPGVTLGKGCLVSAGAVVSKSAPDYSILRGSPAQIVGDVRDLDKKFLKDPEIRKTYFDQEYAASLSDELTS
jgi:acetyltransferase-like isoleucine patch superfamily enzyme